MNRQSVRKRSSVDLVTTTFRANVNYELILFDHLAQEQQALLSELTEDPDFYGVLSPKDPKGRSLRSVCPETALLFLTLQTPGRLPHYLVHNKDENLEEAISKLVLDEILEIQQGDRFITGAAAYQFLFGEEPDLTAEGYLAELSINALKYAQLLDLKEVSRLSARIYFYNRLPASPDLKHRFPCAEVVAEHLDLSPGDRNRVVLDRYWSQPSTSASQYGWLLWQHRQASRPSETGQIKYKLYVSPRLEEVAETFGTCVRVFTELQVRSFKIGRDLYGILRPDKLVAYFETAEDLHSAADRLKSELEGCPSHGVPFTAEFVDNGLLSWGMDPPKTQQRLQWQERESWRLWLTNRLAIALLSAKTAKQPQPWRFALERLHLEGVDTRSWTPTQDIWSDNLLETR